MPTYAYRCKSCEHSFDRYLLIEEREKPLNEACEKCSEKSIVRDYTNFTQPIASDTNLTPNKKTGGQWNELMTKIKKGIPKRYHSNLDAASSRSGHKWH